MTFKDRPDLDPGEQNRSRIATVAEEHGWAVVSRNPMILERPDKRIMITFNGAGNPTSASWGGDEFDSMNATGYVDMSILLNKWLPWKAEDE